MAKLDPIEKVLADLGKLRGSLTTDLLRLPAPDPFKRGLGDVDGLLSRLEDDIQSIHSRLALAGEIRYGKARRIGGLLTPAEWARQFWGRTG